jgi:hypothetical protein
MSDDDSTPRPTLHSAPRSPGPVSAQARGEAPGIRTSGHSTATGANPVEVAGDGCRAVVRDARHPNGGFLIFPVTEWRAFLAGVKGEHL